MEIVEQFYSNGLMTPLKANKPICASSGKENNTTDKTPARAYAQPEIDFLQGKVSGSIFMLNYFVPSYISDLQTRIINASKKLLQNIKP